MMADVEEGSSVVTSRLWSQIAALSPEPLPSRHPRFEQPDLGRSRQPAEQTCRGQRAKELIL